MFGREPVTAYMCLTDFDFELGYASCAHAIYPSIEYLKERVPHCYEQCGVVEVTINFVKVVKEPNYDSGLDTDD